MRLAQVFALLVAVILSGCHRGERRSSTPAPEQNAKKAPAAQRVAPEVSVPQPQKTIVAPTPKKEAPVTAQVTEKPKQPAPPEVITKEVDGKKYTATILATGPAIGNPKQPPAVNVRADITDKDGKTWNVHYQRTGAAMKMNVAQGASTMLVTCDDDTWTLSRGKCNITETLRGTKVTMSAIPVENPAQIKTAQEMLNGAKHLLYIVYELLDPQEKGSVEGEFAGFHDLLPTQNTERPAQPEPVPAEVVPAQEEPTTNATPEIQKVTAEPVVTQNETPTQATLPMAKTQKEPAASSEETSPSLKNNETEAAKAPEPTRTETPLPAETKPVANKEKESTMDGRDEMKNTAPETTDNSGTSPILSAILLGLGTLAALCALGYLGYVFLKKNPPGTTRPGSPMDNHIKHIEGKMGRTPPERKQIAAITQPRQETPEETETENAPE